MKYKSSSSYKAGGAEWEILPVRFQNKRAGKPDYHERETRLDIHGNTGSYREIYFDQIHIGYFDLSLCETLIIRRREASEGVTLQFVLNGRGEIVFEEIGEQLKFESHQHNIFFCKTRGRKMVWQLGEVRLLEVQMSPVFFESYLPEEHRLFEAFRNKIKKEEFSSISDQNLPINPKMVGVILDIVHCHCSCTFKRMLLETKVLELLLWQMNQMFEDNCPVCSLKKEDVEKMHSVRKFILANMTEDYSLAELAREVGTNEFTLKKGFKELFGMTVFGFWNTVKMDQAKKLLLESELNIGEIAGKVGFKHPQHFTAAFKRKFGIVPSQFRKG